MTKLDRLLEGIDPSKTYDLTSRQAGEALARFPAGKGAMTDGREFRAYMARLYCHLNRALLGAEPPRRVNEKMEWFGCQKLLKRELGEGGDRAAFEIARTGNEGGLAGLTLLLAESLAEQTASDWVSNAICRYLSSLSPGERVDAPREYMAKHGRLLPSEMTEGSGARIIVSFAKTLEEHPRLIRKLRRSSEVIRSPAPVPSGAPAPPETTKSLPPLPPMNGKRAKRWEPTSKR